MENLYPHTIIFSLYLLFHFSSPYTLPDHYFINCGSSSNVTINGRNFTGDTNSHLLSTAGETTINPSTVNPPLYQTARIFKNPSFYSLQIRENGIYVVRFHFYPFLSLPNAQFNVSVHGFTLLVDFHVPNATNSPLIKEFLLTIHQPKLEIHFTPSKPSSFAFVNAIEAFIAPQNFTPNSHVLHTIHRINIGGPKLTQDSDTLLRNWVGDDDYLFFKGAARNSSFYESVPNYLEGGADEFTAPNIVYQTAKQLNRESDSKENTLFNMTWRFNVTKNASHFVRAHFCDIVNVRQSYGKFNFFVDEILGGVISPVSVYPQFATPFYTDVTGESDDSGFMSISIGSRSDSDSQDIIPFINGLEIMEIMKDLPSFVPRESMKKKNTVFVIIGSAVGGVVFLILLLVVLFWLKCGRAKPVDSFDRPLVLLHGGRSYATVSSRNVNASPGTLNLGLKLNFDEILYATNSFDPKLMIGEGGFGKVYKGTLRIGTKVAVKRSEPGHGQGLSEFNTEIMVLSKIRFIHLVSLIGYCDERSEMILVYEFMEKGTLREHLYSSNNQESKLSWSKRLEICIGAARGIHYLHTCLDGGIIHRDVKSTNILLDENYVAKVADFGLSRLGLPGQTHVSTEVKGSFGYLDPEYFRCLHLTQKSDVYSFGVVLLEVLCARPAINIWLPRDEVNLADWGISRQKIGELEKIIDPFLVGKINPNSLRKFGETVEKCLRESGVERPSMVDVTWDLEYALQLQQTRVVREPHEDSTTTTNEYSWGQFAMPLGINPLDSQSIAIEEDYLISDVSSTSFGNASGVFSQLKVDDAR
ncbi:hypothetical protein LguiA_017601 [Lonicera macranthoides]